MPEDDDNKAKHTLFVELEDKLWTALEARVEKEQKKNPNRRVTRAEVVRNILSKDLRP
jgi:hypothetical protein